MIEVGQIYRHFKGNYYYILDLAIDSETNNKSVVYQSLYDDNKIWVRDMEMFNEKIDQSKPENIYNQVERFKLVDLREEIKAGLLTAGSQRGDSTPIHKDVPRMMQDFKGNIYYVKYVATNTETNDIEAVYQMLYGDSNIYTMKIKSFRESVDPYGPDNVTGQNEKMVGLAKRYTSQ